MKLSALVLVTWAVASCASAPELKQQLETKTEVTASISEMPFQPSHFSETEVVTLDREQPAFEFPEGKSFYAARAIPNAQTARKLQFKTYLSIGFLPKANVLVPYLLFLDESKRSIGRIQTITLRRGIDFWRGIYFEGELAIPATASYFVLYTVDAEYPKLYSVSQSGTERLVPHAPVEQLL